MEDVLFEFFRGDTYSRDFSITGWGSEITKAFFTVKENIKEKRHVLQKTLGNGIYLVDETEDTKIFNISICCTDTDEMKTDHDYIFDVEIHSETGTEVIKKTIITGILRLKASATKTCNEC